jgi:hypothetical protein
MSTELLMPRAIAASIFLLRIRNVKPHLCVGAFIFRLKHVQLAEVIDMQATVANVDNALRASITTADPQLHTSDQIDE